MVRAIWIVVLSLFHEAAWAADEPFINLEFSATNLLILFSTVLVFVMHLGFSALEAGLAQRKNTANVLFKNLGVLSIGLITYALVGYGLMYPGEAFSGSFFGFGDFGVEGNRVSADGDSYSYYTDFIFQAMFAATAATIVSGAVAERIKLTSFLVFAALLVSICYPIVGMWKWGGGWLDTLSTPFYDFAGSTLVHSVGGWAALAAVMILGPRIGKYGENGKINAIYPHSMPLACIGALLLWFGWYGFNGGSVLAADFDTVSRVFVTTSLAAAAGIVGSAIGSLYFVKSLDLANGLNGALAGLVGITAGADVISPMASLFVGLVAGVLVVGSVVMFDKLRLDDPVGALSVHLVCGIWGTLAVGLFGSKAGLDQLVSQGIGIAAVGATTFGFSYIAVSLVKRVMGWRVTEEEEVTGLDIAEHGISAYRGFQFEWESGHRTSQLKIRRVYGRLNPINGRIEPDRTSDPDRPQPILNMKKAG